MALETQEKQERKVYPKFHLYHAKQDGKGAASQWSINEKGLFLEIAAQTGTNTDGNETFGWKGRDGSNSITMKLGLPDIGEMLTVLHGFKGGVGQEKIEGGKTTYGNLFHKNANGSTTLSFSPWEKDGRLQGYNLRVTAKVGQNPAVVIGHNVTLSESQALRVLLERSVCMLCNWF